MSADDKALTLRQLSVLAVAYDLRQRAEEGFLRFLENTYRDGDLPPSFTPQSFYARFRAISVTFESVLVSYQFIRTSLDVFHGDLEVGSYDLITSLEGEDLDDILILGEPLLDRLQRRIDGN